MGASSDHALLSPSGASRWIACPPSLRLEEMLPDSTSSYAEEGTLAHAFAENALKSWFGVISETEAIEQHRDLVTDPMFSPDMLDYVDDYVQFCVAQYEELKKQTPDAIVSIERKFDISELLPESFGTNDFSVVAEPVLSIVDLKYGKGVSVSAINNKQMKIYAIGALLAYDLLYDIKTVRLTIYQPRIGNVSTWETSVEELWKWANDELIPRGAMAYNGEGEFNPGSHCTFCKAKVRCKALAEANMKLAIEEFGLQDPRLLSDDDIAKILDNSDQISKWLKAIEDYTFAQAMAGKKWPGYKLVRGRSSTKYSDEASIIKAVTKSGISEDSIITRNLIGVTAMTKLLGAKKYKEIIGPYLTKNPGAPTLVPEDDKREEFSPTQSAENDFEEFL